MPFYPFSCARTECGEQHIPFEKVEVIVNQDTGTFCVDALVCMTCDKINSAKLPDAESAADLINNGATRIDIGTDPEQYQGSRRTNSIQEVDSIAVLTIQLGSVRDIGQLERGFPI